MSDSSRNCSEVFLVSLEPKIVVEGSSDEGVFDGHTCRLIPTSQASLPTWDLTFQLGPPLALPCHLLGPVLCSPHSLLQGGLGLPQNALVPLSPAAYLHRLRGTLPAAQDWPLSDPPQSASLCFTENTPAQVN